MLTSVTKLALVLWTKTAQKLSLQVERRKTRRPLYIDMEHVDPKALNVILQYEIRCRILQAACGSRGVPLRTCASPSKEE